MFVAMRLRKPWRRFWIRRLAPDMVGRGPQRIWLAQPARAGCEETAVLETRSRVASPVAVVVVAEGVNCVMVVVLVPGARKMGERERVVGRRVGRWVNVLLVWGRWLVVCGF